MCLVRMRQEGRAGKYMCRYIVHSMWEDVEQRSKIMGVSPARGATPTPVCCSSDEPLPESADVT